MMNTILTIVGCCLIGYKMGWEVGLGAYLCTIAVLNTVIDNLRSVLVSILRQLK